MKKNIYKAIYKQIKKYDTIVIARHIGPDPDALSSSIALRDVILNTFPNKKVYTVGSPAAKFKFLGILDKFNEEMYDNSLLIVVDTPDKKRVDSLDPDKFAYKIKIDHHPFIEKYCDLEWIDDKASSAAQMIIELIFNTKLKMSKEAAEKLFIGVISDTNRFLYYYTTSKTFSLISKLIKKTNLDFTSLYEPLYLRPLKEIKFQGYISNNMVVTENGLAHIKITEDLMNEYDVDAATAGNLVTNFNYIEEIIVWVVFSYDKENNLIRSSIRSRGPIINDTAAHFGGGGHIYASGARLKTF
ncbi:MAG TPA: bifunctional oligoribonuclease/PAP phosphatase NrnA, partial [Tenericutes bacterium]|nr:bifunctional oligoribonuclease/PAP phosphatase NrnA [Mycoplasmatota bacterium]